MDRVAFTRETDRTTVETRLPGQYRSIQVRVAPAVPLNSPLSPEILLPATSPPLIVEPIMRASLALFAGLVLGLSLMAFARPGSRDDETPIGTRWWPSPWGADDQRGAANRMTPARAKA